MTKASWAKAIDRLVGARIEARRRKAVPPPRKLTQDGLSRRTKGVVSRSSIANIERGLQGVSLMQLYALARALNVEARELLPSLNDVFRMEEEPFASLSRKLPQEEQAWVERVRTSDNRNLEPNDA